MRRDDADRLLIAAGLLWLWFMPAIAPVFAEVLGIGYVPVLIGNLTLLVLAGLLLWREIAAIRPLLILAAVANVVVAFVANPESPFVIALVAIGSLAIAVGAARARVPASRDAAATERPQAPPPLDRTAPPRPKVDDIADDPSVVAFLDAVAHLAPGDLPVLSAAWKAIDPDARDQAWRAVRREAERTNRDAILDELRAEIELWGRAGSGSPWTWSFGTMADVDRGNARRAAMPALFDAAAAILLRDRLAPRDREVLAAPWESVAAAAPTTAELHAAARPS